MRLALHPTGETGHRAGRILLAEPSLEALGIYGHRSPTTEERRATAITSLAGFAVLATDDTVAPLDLAAIAVDDGLSCVLAADTDPGPDLAARFATRGLSLLVAASLPGLAEALAHRAEAGGSGGLLLAWTRQGKPGRREIAVPFPEPVGARWGARLPPRPGDPPGDTRVEVTLEGPWAGALARVTSGTGRRRVERLVGRGRRSPPPRGHRPGGRGLAAGRRRGASRGLEASHRGGGLPRRRASGSGWRSPAWAGATERRPMASDRPAARAQVPVWRVASPVAAVRRVGAVGSGPRGSLAVAGGDRRRQRRHLRQ